MANMSYCRFHNTYYALRDCVNAVDEAVEEGMNMKQFLESLSSEERYAFHRLATYCQDFIYSAEALEDPGLTELEKVL